MIKISHQNALLISSRPLSMCPKVCLLYERSSGEVKRSQVISDPASLHSANMGSDCGLEIHNHSWHIQHLQLAVFTHGAKTSCCPPQIHTYTHTHTPPGPLGWPCPWATTPNSCCRSAAMDTPCRFSCPFSLGPFSLLWALPAGVL